MVTSVRTGATTIAAPRQGGDDGRAPVDPRDRTGITPWRGILLGTFVGANAGLLGREGLRAATGVKLGARGTLAMAGAAAVLGTIAGAALVPVVNRRDAAQNPTPWVPQRGPKWAQMAEGALGGAVFGTMGGGVYGAGVHAAFQTGTARPIGPSLFVACIAAGTLIGAYLGAGMANADYEAETARLQREHDGESFDQLAGALVRSVDENRGP